MIKNKNILITGSSSGLGFELAKILSKRKFNVIINGKNKKKLKKSAELINTKYFFPADVTLKSDLLKFLKYLKQKKLKIDVLLCNYGESNFKKNNLSFRESFEKNFFSSIYTVEVFLPLLKNNSKIIFISSICGNELIDGAPIAYSLAKNSLNSYVKAISKHLFLNHKVTINSISPGNLMFKGSLWEKKIKENKTRTLRYIKDNVPSNSFGKPENILNVINMIISDQDNYINGSNFIIDGGQTKSF